MIHAEKTQLVHYAVLLLHQRNDVSTLLVKHSLKKKTLCNVTCQFLLFPAVKLVSEFHMGRSFGHFTIPVREREKCQESVGVVKLARDHYPLQV